MAQVGKAREWRIHQDESGVYRTDYYGPELVTGEVVTAIESTPTTRAAEEMREALKTQHAVIDKLLAMLIVCDRSFMPTQSSVWPAAVVGNEILQRIEAEERGES